MATKQQLRAGVARANITPPVGIDLCGFAGRGNSRGVLDDLYASALVLDDGRRRVAVVALDLVFLSEDYVRQVSDLVAKRAKIEREDVVLCCSHTHYGPETSGYERDPCESDQGAYMAHLKFTIAGVVAEATRGMSRAELLVGRSTCGIGINRRERLDDGRIILGNNPEGVIDRELIAVRVDGPRGEPMACLANFACHAVSQGSQGRLISSDFVGPARELFESWTGAMFIFLQGACGNINSLELVNDPEVPRRLGGALGSAAVEAFVQAEPVTATPVKAKHKKVDLPAKSFASVAEGEGAVAELETELARLRSTQGHKGAIHWAQSRLERARGMLDDAAGRSSLPPISATLHALRFGDVALATSPGEVFCEIGIAIRERSSVPHTMFAGYTNGSIGYVPIPEAYPEGGYEVTHACRVGPGAAGIITETASQLLAQVKRGR